MFSDVVIKSDEGEDEDEYAISLEVFSRLLEI